MIQFPTDLPGIAALLGAALLRAGLCGGLALALAWVVTRAPALSTPSARCWIWRLALLQLFVAFFWSRPLLELPVMPSRARLSGATPAALPRVAERPGDPSPLTREGHPGSSGPGRTGTAWDPGSLLAAGWALAALAGVVLLAREWRRSLWLERQLTPVEDGALLARCGTLARRLGLPYVPYVGSAPELETPTLLGMTRLTVALPANLLRTASEEDLELIMAHELAHVRRKDLHWTWLPVLARTFFFFHPLVWLAQREVHLAQEGACDALAMECTGTTLTRYGELLLRVSTDLGAPHGRLAAARMGEPFSHIARRLKVIKHALPITPARRAASALLVGGMLLVGLTPWQLSARAAAISPTPAGSQGGVAAAAPGGRVAAGPYTLRVTRVQKGGSSYSSGGGGGVITGPGGRGSGAAPAGQPGGRAGLAIDLEVFSPDPAALTLLTGIAPGARGIDNLGGPAVSGPLQPMLPPVLGTEGGRIARIELDVDPAASSLRVVEAALQMHPAEERVLVFPARELRAGAEKRAGSVTVRIDNVEATADGWQVAVSYETGGPGGTLRPSDPLDRVRQVMQAARNVSVTLLDSHGQRSGPRTSGGGGSSGARTSVSGRSNTRGSHTITEGRGPHRSGPVRTSGTYGFARANGAELQALEFRVLERTGEPQRFPFRLENLSLLPTQ